MWPVVKDVVVAAGLLERIGQDQQAKNSRHAHPTSRATAAAVRHRPKCVHSTHRWQRRLPELLEWLTIALGKIAHNWRVRLPFALITRLLRIAKHEETASVPANLLSSLMSLFLKEKKCCASAAPAKSVTSCRANFFPDYESAPGLFR
jgi:hypothetical protein